MPSNPHTARQRQINDALRAESNHKGGRHLTIKRVKVSSKGQITLPRRMLERIGAAPGDSLQLHLVRGAIVVTHPRQSVTEETAGSLTSFVPKHLLGKSWEEIMRVTKQRVSAKLAKEGTTS